MRFKQTASDRVFSLVLGLISVTIFFLVLYPLFFVIIASFSTPEAVVTGQVTFWPIGFTLESYSLVLQERQIWVGYRNSIFYASVGTLINMTMTTLGAYALSREDFPFRTFFTFFVAFTMWFSGGMIPTFLVVRDLGMLDTVWAMLIPGAISTWNLLIMKNYFQSSIPKEMHEASIIDGATDFQLLVRVILPLSKPIIAVLSLFYIVGHWNAFFGALIYLRSPELQPLQIVLRGILLQNNLEILQGEAMGMLERIMRGETMKYAVIVVSSLPMIIIYPFAQKFFIRGVMVGAIKG